MIIISLIDLSVALHMLQISKYQKYYSIFEQDQLLNFQRAKNSYIEIH